MGVANHPPFGQGVARATSMASQTGVVQPLPSFGLEGVPKWAPPIFSFFFHNIKIKNNIFFILHDNKKWTEPRQKYQMSFSLTTGIIYDTF